GEWEGGDRRRRGDGGRAVDRGTVSRRAPAAEQARSEGALVAAPRNGKKVRRRKGSGIAGTGERLLFALARGHDVQDERLDIRADQVARAGDAGDDGAAGELPGHRHEPTGQPEGSFQKERPQRNGPGDGAPPSRGSCASTPPSAFALVLAVPRLRHGLVPIRFGGGRPPPS